MENEIVKVESSPVEVPVEVIRSLVEKGASPESIDKYLDVQFKWEANQAMKAYHKAMAEFKENPPEILKDKNVGYSTSKGNVGYSHASLANVVSTITKALSQHGLSASWKTQQNGKIVVTCNITHILGHTEETSLSADADSSGSKNSIQAMGSTITYLERYTLLAILGLATHDQDNDAQSVNESIDEKQLHSLRDGLIDADAKEAPLCKYLKIEKLEDMAKSDYQKAVNAIAERKKGRGEK